MKAKYYLLSMLCFLVTSNLKGQLGEVYADGTKVDSVKDVLITDKPKYPDIGYDWDSLYKDDSQSTIDSVINWVNQFSFTAPHLTVKTIIDVCGKYFFRMDSKTIKKLLMNNSSMPKDKFPEDFKYWKGRLKPLIDSLPRTPIDNLGEQEWDEEFYFTTNYSYGYFVTFTDFDDFVGMSSISTSISQLKYKYDSTYQIVVPEFQTILDSIHLNPDKWVRWLLYMQLMEKLYSINAHKYLTTVTNEIYVITSTSIKSNSHDADMIICAKLLASVDPYAFRQVIYSYLRFIQSKLILTNDDKYYYQKSEIIRALFWNSLPGLYSKSSAWEIVNNLYKENYYKGDTLDFKFITLLSRIYSDYSVELFLSDIQLNEVTKMGLYCYILTSVRLHENLSKQKYDESVRYTFRMHQNLAFYYFNIEKDYPESRKYQFYSLKTLIDSKDPKFLAMVPQVILKIIDTYRGEGQYQKSIEWWSILDSNSFEANLGALFKLPLDENLWKPKHYKLLSNFYKKYNISALLANQRSNQRYINQQWGRHVTLKLARFEAERRNWKDAYYFSRVADSLRFEPDVGGAGEMMSSGVQSFYSLRATLTHDSIVLFENNISGLNYQINELQFERNNLLYDINLYKERVKGFNIQITSLTERAKSLKDSNSFLADSNTRLSLINQEYNSEIVRKKSEIEEKERQLADINNKLLVSENLLANRGIGIAILAFVLVVIITLSVFVWTQRNVARRAKAKAEILSFTMHQIGHLAPQCINNLLQRIGDELTTTAQERLRKLSVLLRTFYDNSFINITYRQEYDLVCDFVDLAYQTSSTTELPSDKIEANWRGHPDLKMPTYVLFNAVQNAFKYGDIWSSNGSDDKVSAKVTQHGNRYEVVVRNKIVTTDDTQITEGSGMRYVKTILKYWNRRKAGNYSYTASNNMFNFKFTFKTKF